MTRNENTTHTSESLQSPQEILGDLVHDIVRMPMPGAWEKLGKETESEWRYNDLQLGKERWGVRVTEVTRPDGFVNFSVGIRGRYDIPYKSGFLDIETLGFMGKKSEDGEELTIKHKRSRGATTVFITDTDERNSCLQIAIDSINQAVQEHEAAEATAKPAVRQLPKRWLQMLARGHKSES